MKKLLQQHRVSLFLIKALVLYLGFSSQAFAQQIVQGKVTDEKNEPLIGVNVLVKGTNKGTNTDIDGSFKIDAGEKGVLLFNFIGYTSKTVTVGNQSIINVSMEQDNKVLNEVVVVGYGSQNKKKILGSVQTINAKELKDLPVSQISQKLQGKMAGVQINQTTGKPGAGMAIRIRGQASILAGSDPLYVVDGVIANDIKAIDPNTIESINILKDASAAGIYGAAGSTNGVVIITTKHGTKGTPKTDVTFYTGIQQIVKQLPMLSNSQWLD